MDEELRKKLQCEKCHKPFNDDSEVRIYDVCQHHSCDSCYRSITTYNCPICKCSTSDRWIELSEHILSILKNHESSIVKIIASEIASRDEIINLKEKVSMLEAPKEDHHKCMACETSDSEQNLQLCETCHGLKFEDLEDVKRNALCPACAIKKHMRKGHQTVDFYPYLSAHNFSSHSSNIDSKSEKHKQAHVLLKNTFTSFSTLSVHVSENYNVLTDMARRSKSTKQQVEFFEKMEKFIDKSKSIHGDADSDMKNHTAKLEETLVEIKEWYEGRMKDCVDQSEIIKLQNSEDSENNDTEVDA